MQPIIVQCPSCQFMWWAATLSPQDGIAPATVAKQCVCPVCGSSNCRLTRPKRLGYCPAHEVENSRRVDGP